VDKTLLIGLVMTEDFSSANFKKRLGADYEKKKKFYEKLVEETLYMLSEELGKKGIKYHSLAPRKTKIKTFESFYEKVKRKQVKDKQFEKIEDVAGIRVICLYRSDLEKIGDIISANFKIIKQDTSKTRTETPFGYSSDHYVVRIPKRCKGARYDNIKSLSCEIQVRTVLMDAWASVSHHLDYKQELDVPTTLRANFNALAGLFYVADTNFEWFREGIEKLKADFMKEAKGGTLNLNQEVNLDNLRTYIEYRFPDRHKGEYPKLIAELRTLGYQIISQLDKNINRVLPILNKFEKELVATYKEHYKTPFFSRTGIVKCILGIIHEEYLTPDTSEDFARLARKYRAKLS